jgi:TonB family protein
MRRGLLLMLAAACLAHAAPAAAQTAAPAQAEAGRWSRYTYPGEEFSAELPAMPWVFRTRRSIPPRHIESEPLRVFGLYSGGVVFMVVSFERPHDAETFEEFAGYGWGVRPGPAKRELKLAGFAGREYDLGGGFKGAMRVFRAKRHVYLVRAFSDAGGREQAAERFMNSLMLGANPSGEAVAEDPPPPPPTPAPAPTVVGPGRGGAAGGEAAPGDEEALRLARRAGAPNDAAAAGPFTRGDVARRAVIVYKPEPGYTEEARMHNVSGTVRLRAILSASGKVTSLSVVKGLPDGLTERALLAARHLLFFPAVKDGREASQYVVLEYNFNIY